MRLKLKKKKEGNVKRLGVAELGQCSVKWSGWATLRRWDCSRHAGPEGVCWPWRIPGKSPR